MALTLIFDADDTRWENNVVFERVRDDFFAWLAHPDEAHACAVREEIETAHVAAYGYGWAVSYARDRVAHLRGRPVTDAERAAIDEPAATFVRHEVELMTKGDPAEQQAMIEGSGLGGHSRSVHVVPRKDVATYRAPAAEPALDPSTTWMIGDSPRSDILPARVAGPNAVFVPHPHTWEHEEAEVDDPDVLTVGSLRDLAEHF